MSVITSEDELERRVAERTAALLEALRSSEARFRALIENSLDITAIVDAETRLKYISSSVTAVLGYEPEELLGQTTFDYVHPDDAELVSASFRRGAESPDGLEPLEFRARRKDGTWLLMDARGLNLLHDPAVAGMVITARDVTARRALEERVRQSERLEAVGQLAGGVAHDFNNFLLVIRGYSSVLRSSLEDPQLRADVDEIANAADPAVDRPRPRLPAGCGPGGRRPGADRAGRPQPRLQRARRDARRRRAAHRCRRDADVRRRARDRTAADAGVVRDAHRGRHGHGHRRRRAAARLRAVLHDEGRRRRHGSRPLDRPRD